jgi:hypothetical protein
MIRRREIISRIGSSSQFEKLKMKDKSWEKKLEQKSKKQVSCSLTKHTSQTGELFDKSELDSDEVRNDGVDKSLEI